MNSYTRRPLAAIGFFGISQIKQQNPLMVAWWTAVFPGFGHYLLNQYIRACFLTLFEVFTNTFAHINEAMVYSFCGKFDLAKSIVEPKWTYAYIAIYLISIGDTYRSTIYQNKLYHLSMQEKQEIPCQRIFKSEIHYLEKKNPVFSVIYSIFFPGLGQLYNHRFGLAFYAVLWWIIYLALTDLHEAVFLLLQGNIKQSSTMLPPHWLLFMPSIVGGAIYDSYRTTIEHNQLFNREQRNFLTERYKNFKIRISR